MATAVSTYGFINAKLRARISKLLDEEFFRQMAGPRSMMETVACLNGTRYEQVTVIYNQTGDIKLCELELVRQEYRALEALKRYTPEGILDFTAALLGQYEVMTLKNAIRLWFERTVRGRRVDDKVAYLERDEAVADLPVDAVINAPDSQQLLAALETTGYAEIVREPLDRLPEDGSLFAVEAALDRHYYSRLVARARELSRTDATVALRLIGIQIDMQNVNWLVRMKQFHDVELSRLVSSIIPGGALIPPEELSRAYATDSPLDVLLSALGPKYTAGVAGAETHEEERRQLRRLTMLENLLRSILFAEIHRALGGYPFTIGTILAYYLLVRNEIGTLISVLNAKAYDLGPDRIEGLL